MLTPITRLRNKFDGEVVGYICEGKEIQDSELGLKACVALSKDKLLELDKDLTSYIDYLELQEIQVLYEDGNYVDFSLVLSQEQRYENVDIPFEYDLPDNAIVWGYLIRLRDLIKLDDSSAIRRAVTGSEM